MSDGMVFCHACGASIHSTAPVCPRCGAPQTRMAAAGYPAGDGITRDPRTSVMMCFEKYVDFSGRAPRGEFWWFQLAYFVASSVLSILSTAGKGSALGSLIVAISVAFWLGCLLPGIAVGVRRLHDTDRSGWWLLIWFVPLVGWILLLVWLASRGTSGPNQYGAENGTALS